MYVEKQTIDLSGGSASEELLRGSEEGCSKAMRIQQIVSRAEHARVVIHDGNSPSPLLHRQSRPACADKTAGKSRPRGPGCMTGLGPKDTCLFGRGKTYPYKTRRIPV